MSAHLYTLFAQTVIAAGYYVLTLLPGALRHGNCTCKLGQKLCVQLCLMFQRNSPRSLQGKGLSSAILGDCSKDGSITVTGLLEAVNLQVLSMLRAPVFSALQVGSKGQWNGPNLQARQERRCYFHLTDGMLKLVHTHLKAPLSRKAGEKGTEID